MTGGTIIIDNLDKEATMIEEIMALVRVKVAEDENIGKALDVFLASNDSDTILSMDGTLEMARIAGVLTPELSKRADANRAGVTRS